MFYKLDAQKNVVECTIEEYAASIKNKGHVERVAKDECDNYMLSTVFLGLDMHCNQRPPICFETCLFLDGDNDVLNRYATWEEAELMHKFYLRVIKGLKARDALSFDEIYRVLKTLRG